MATSSSPLALLANLTMRGRIVLGGSLLAFVIIVFFGLQIAGAPSYTLVAAGIDPAQTAKITAALDAKGITYQLRNNGTALAVESSQTASARIALATQGLSGTGTNQPGFELFDKQKLGTSDFQQKVTYQRALEGQIATTIEQVQGVSGAQVRLVMPDDQLFSESQTPATAAVLLEGSSAGLDPGAVRGIAQLVASSVKGLKPANVSITDGTGVLLWPQSSDGSGGDGGGLLAKQAVDARYEQQLEGTINGMLLRTLGPGKAEVSVAADVDTNSGTQDTLAYAKKGVPLSTKTDTESLKGGSVAGGASGTTGNIPTYAQNAAGGAGSNYKHTTKDIQLGVDKTVTHTTLAPGKVNHLAVSLMVDKSVPAKDQAAIQSAVAAAAGLVTTAPRSDTINLSPVSFAKVPKASTPAVGMPAGGMIGYAKYAAAGLGLLIFLFFAARQLRRRENETLMREPRWMSEIAAPTTLAELERPRGSSLPERQDNQARRQIEELATREPERVAQQIRTWMRDS